MAGITAKDRVLTDYANQLQQEAPKGRSLTQDAMRRLTRNKAAVVSIGVVIFIILFAFVGPYFLPWTYDKIDWSGIRKPPNFEKLHYLGTDQNGRDLLSRLLQGTQMSLIVAMVATVVSVVIGIVVTIIILSPLISVLSGADVQAELMDALRSAGSTRPVAPETSSYKDYIYKIYEVYMGDG